MYNPDEECKKIIDKIRIICRQKGITAYALAKKANISTSTVSYILNGKTKPQIYTLFQLCNALEASIHELLEHSDTENTVSGQSYSRNKLSETGLTADEEKLVECYRYLPEKKKEWLKMCMDMLRQYGADNVQ